MQLVFIGMIRHIAIIVQVAGVPNGGLKLVCDELDLVVARLVQLLLQQVKLAGRVVAHTEMPHYVVISEGHEDGGYLIGVHSSVAVVQKQHVQIRSSWAR